MYTESENPTGPHLYTRYTKFPKSNRVPTFAGQESQGPDVSLLAGEKSESQGTLARPEVLHTEDPCGVGTGATSLGGVTSYGWYLLRFVAVRSPRIPPDSGFLNRPSRHKQAMSEEM